MQHPQRNPAANNANKQEDSECDDDISASAADNHISQQAKGDRADEEKQPRFAVLAQKVDHQHRRDEKVKEAF